jgi:pyruvate/2-oxoglutarate dehydrogenase complex dihydrolipoamide dehydrogenase (E3) component
MKFSHDVIVIGGGAAGLTAAGGCALFGLDVALIEAGEMGGECLNNGCVPSKALITAAKRAAEGTGAARHGVTLAKPEVSWSGVHAFVHEAIAEIAPHDSQERFEEMGCEVLRGYARVTGKHSVEVEGRVLTAPRIVIATGSKPFVPPIKGIDEVPYLTNENLFDLQEQPEHLVIVGGGVIGMEMAQSFRRLGSAVTVINPGPLMGRDDPDSVAVVAETMRAEGVEFVDGTAQEVSASGSGASATLRILTDSGDVISGSHLLIAVGRTANASGFGLEELGVEMARNGIKVDARRRSSIKSIYAIGDCRDGPRLTHVSGYEGSNVALEITTGLPTKVDWSALPWCTYTDPEVAQVGMTEAEARAQYGEGVTVIKEGFDHNERAIAEGAVKGHMKLILKGKKVLGASIVGKAAGELLLPLTQSITGKSSTFAMGSAVISYPTRSEIIKAAAFAAWEPTVFGSLPKKYARFVAKMRRIFS